MSDDAAPTPSLPEELGHAPDARLLIVNADDSGLCHAANVATVKALEEGLVTSTTAMPPCPWFPEMVTLARERPGLDVGIHLTLNCEWKRYRWGPVAGADRVPSLVDSDGYLLASEEHTVERGTVEDVRTEVRAQIERAFSLGLEPTHADNHMGPIHYSPPFYEATVEIAEEYGLPMRCVLNHDVAEAHAMPRAASFGMYYDPPEGGMSKFELYEYHLRNLEPGVHEVAIHLALDTDEWRELCRVADDDHPWQDRILDLEFFTADTTRALLEDLGIELIGYRPLQELWARRRAAGAPTPKTEP